MIIKVLTDEEIKELEYSRFYSTNLLKNLEGKHRFIINKRGYGIQKYYELKAYRLKRRVKYDTIITWKGITTTL